MIPIRVSLRNFLSYSSAVLDLNGIHTACICGPNGAGKSALMEALTWGIWGQCRAVTEEDVIRKGQTETQVEVIYDCRGQTYRILRSRLAGGSGSLEWQIQSGTGWRSLTAKGIRNTQQLIQTQLRLDYDTFINSAYLRQGRADEFTLKRSAERKQILAEILKLGQYEDLAEKSREYARQARIQTDVVQSQLDQITTELQKADQVRAEQEDLRVRQQVCLQALEQDQRLWQQGQDQIRERQQWQAHWQQLSDQWQALTTLLQQTEKEWQQQRHLEQELERLIQREAEIQSGLQHFYRLTSQDQRWNQVFQQHQVLTQQREQWVAALTLNQQQHTQRLHALQSQLAVVQAQWQADEDTVSEASRIQQGIQAYRQARTELKEWDHRQAQAAPLLNQLRILQTQLRHEQERLQARQGVLRQQILEGETRQAQVAQLQATASAIALEVSELEKLRIYRQRVQEKVEERRAFVHQLQERQRALQRQWQVLEEQRVLLRDDSIRDCPLCDQSLNPELRTLVLSKHSHQQADLQEQVLVIREQLAVTDREIQILQEEYQSLSAQLQEMDGQLQSQGRLQQQLEAEQNHLQQSHFWQEELRSIEQILHSGQDSVELRAQIATLESQIAAIGYNDKDHSLCRSEVERWRWAESKLTEINKIRPRHERLSQEIQALRIQIQQAHQDVERPDHPLGRLRLQLQQLEGQLESVAYDVTHHQRIRGELSHAQSWLKQWEALQQARQQLPLVRDRVGALSQQVHQQRQRSAELSQDLTRIQQHLSQLNPPSSEALSALVHFQQERRQELDRLLSRLGAVDQQLQQVQQWQDQQADLTQRLTKARQQFQIYQELAHAYGRNGIPALIIENVLPELEAEANQILGKLTGHQLHLQFITQRFGKRSSKLIDTLDILIADSQGTRPYETYSGGEAFRINFAVRLALSRLLAQRSGAHLQTLLIDEGFGTQDQQGRQNLVAAINAVAPDFARILVITHIPSLRDAFPHRIEVQRTASGSTLQLIH